MIKEFNNELQAKAIADSLGLFITKYKGVYIVSNSKEELLAKYNLGFYSRENIFYDRDILKEDADGLLVVKNKNIIDASSIELPYRIRNCSCMFAERTSLKIPPIIPEGVRNCTQMFKDCFLLKAPPIIPEGAQYCVQMFSNCASLRTPPIIPDGVQSCHFMFEGCTSLKKRPRFPKTVTP